MTFVDILAKSRKFLMSGFVFVQESKSETAGEHGSRLSETEDGETLCRYAKAFWSINGDQEKALFYFEKAVEASPNDR